MILWLLVFFPNLPANNFSKPSNTYSLHSVQVLKSRAMGVMGIVLTPSYPEPENQVYEFMLGDSSKLCAENVDSRICITAVFMTVMY